MNGKVTIRLSALAAVLAVLSSCILTLGAPLTRKIEADAWTVEAAGGVSRFGSGDPDGPSGYVYAARALGENWEIGLLPYVYTVDYATALVLTIPVRWDPFPHDWPLHLVPFAGPSLYTMDVTGMGLTAGAGLSWQPFNWFEMYAAGSTLVPYVSFVTVGAGARLHLGTVQAGISAMYSNPGLLVGLVSAGLTLGGR